MDVNKIIIVCILSFFSLALPLKALPSSYVVSWNIVAVVVNKLCSGLVSSSSLSSEADLRTLWRRGPHTGISGGGEGEGHSY